MTLSKTLLALFSFLAVVCLLAASVEAQTSRAYTQGAQQIRNWDAVEFETVIDIVNQGDTITLVRYDVIDELGDVVEGYSVDLSHLDDFEYDTVLPDEEVDLPPGAGSGYKIRVVWKLNGGTTENYEDEEISGGA